MTKNKYRSIFISDFHLGMYGVDSRPLLKFLKENDAEYLYLIGDIIDGWALKSRWHWPQINNEIIFNIIQKANKGTRVFWIIGNHDEFINEYKGIVKQVTITKEAFYLTKDSRMFMIIHGDKFDPVMVNARWLMFFGNIAYEFAFNLTKYIRYVRRILGRPEWSFSLWAKRSVKGAINFISNYEELMVEEARQNNCQGIISGHIHTPMIKEFNGITYFNCGDWVESHSAVVEDLEGNFKLIETERKKGK